MNCSNCQAEIPPHIRLCQVCSRDNGFPNVRAASDPAETAALDERYEAVLAEVTKRGTYSKVKEFEQAVTKESKAVLARSLARSVPVLFGDQQVFLSFYLEVDLGIRNPEDNEWDGGRELADSTLFPFYHRNIHFAALAIGSSGVPHYGPVSMVLKEAVIRERTSVFEENSRRWVDRMRRSSSKLSPGHRADWTRRHVLAVAKLGSRIAPDAGLEDFRDLLLAPSARADSDFIEVHIYQPLHRDAVEAVYLQMPPASNTLDVQRALAIQAAMKDHHIPCTVES